MFRLTIPLVAGIFVSDHFFQGALPVLVSGTGILGCLIGLIVLMKWQGYLSRWLFGGMVFMFLFCVGALLLQQKWQRVDYEWSSGKNMYQGVIVDVPQEKAKTYLCKLRIDKEMSERGMVPVNRMILVYIMKDSLSVNLRCGDHLNFYTRISTPEREVIPGEFDYAAYLFRQQISGTAVIFPGYWQWTGKKSALTWKQRAGVWREKILDSYRKWGFSGDEFAVLSALTVGYKEDQQDSFSDLGTLAVLIIILVFIVMAAQFESLTYPFIIMFSIPFAFSGVLMALYGTGTTLNVMSLLGGIMLIGIVVKNGIVLIDYITLCRERGMSVIHSVVVSGRSRLRPVLMTTLTTILGMVPMAIGGGEGSEMWQPLGVSVIGGLTVSTVLTLILVPVLYCSFAGTGIKRNRKKMKASRELNDYYQAHKTEMTKGKKE